MTVAAMPDEFNQAGRPAGDCGTTGHFQDDSFWYAPYVWIGS